MEVFMYITKLTWKEIEQIPFHKSILFIPIAPIEEHGHIYLSVSIASLLKKPAAGLQKN
jgi:hypothetical protein